MIAPRPLAVADKFVYDENNGGGRRRKTRHVSRRFCGSENDGLRCIGSFQDRLRGQQSSGWDCDDAEDDLRRRLIQINEADEASSEIHLNPTSS